MFLVMESFPTVILILHAEGRIALALMTFMETTKTCLLQEEDITIKLVKVSIKAAITPGKEIGTLPVRGHFTAAAMVLLNPVLASIIGSKGISPQATRSMDSISKKCRPKKGERIRGGQITKTLMRVSSDHFYCFLRASDLNCIVERLFKNSSSRAFSKTHSQPGETMPKGNTKDVSTTEFCAVFCESGGDQLFEGMILWSESFFVFGNMSSDL